MVRQKEEPERGNVKVGVTHRRSMSIGLSRRCFAERMVEHHKLHQRRSLLRSWECQIDIRIHKPEWGMAAGWFRDPEFNEGR